MSIPDKFSNFDLFVAVLKKCPKNKPSKEWTKEEEETLGIAIDALGKSIEDTFPSVKRLPGGMLFIDPKTGDEL